MSIISISIIMPILFGYENLSSKMPFPKNGTMQRQQILNAMKQLQAKERHIVDMSQSLNDGLAELLSLSARSIADGEKHIETAKEQLRKGIITREIYDLKVKIFTDGNKRLLQTHQLLDNSFIRLPK